MNSDPETLFYLSRVLIIIAQKIGIPDSEWLGLSELRDSIRSLQPSVAALFEDYEAAYKAWAAYFDEDRSFAQPDTEKYFQLMEARDSTRLALRKELGMG